MIFLRSPFHHLDFMKKFWKSGKNEKYEFCGFQNFEKFELKISSIRIIRIICRNSLIRIIRIFGQQINIRDTILSFQFQWDILRHEGMIAEGKRKINKYFPFLFGTQSKAQAGWPTCLRLVRATLRADFAVITAQLWSTITAIFSWLNKFAFNCYLRPRSWDYCQIFKTTDLFLLNAGLFQFSLSEMLWDTSISVSAQRFEPGGFIKPRRFRIIFP